MGSKKIMILAVGMTLFIFSNGNWTIPMASWLAPVFLLFFLQAPSKKRQLFFLFLAILVSTKFMLGGIIPTSIGILYYILTVYYALMWFFPYWMHALFSDRIKGFKSTLLFPASAVAAEYLNTVFFGSWGSMAYTQFGNIPLMQLASLFGIWGLTFVILWFGAVVNWCFKENHIMDQVRSGGWIYAAVFAGVMIFGGLRMLIYSPARDSGTIASFTPVNEIDDFFDKMNVHGYSSSFTMLKEAPERLFDVLEETHEAMFKQMDSISHPGTSYVVWPEAGVDVLEAQEVRFVERGKEISNRKNLYTMLAYYLIPDSESGRKPENKSVFIDPTGQVIYEYLKAYPVPGAAHKAGEKRIPVADTPDGRIGTAICYDMDFTGLIHQAGRQKVDIMIVPSWDWKDIDPLHTQMAVFRGVENGFSIIRQAGEGLSMVSDPLGRVIASMDYFTSPDNVMYSQAPIKRMPTLYAIIGDSFAWLCCLGWLVLVFIPLFKNDKVAG